MFFISGKLVPWIHSANDPSKAAPDRSAIEEDEMNPPTPFYRISTETEISSILKRNVLLCFNGQSTVCSLSMHPKVAVMLLEKTLWHPY